AAGWDGRGSQSSTNGLRAHKPANPRCLSRRHLIGDFRSDQKEAAEELPLGGGNASCGTPRPGTGSTGAPGPSPTARLRLSRRPSSRPPAPARPPPFAAGCRSTSLSVRGGTPIEKLLDRVAALECTMQELQSERRAAERRANRWRGLAAVLALLVVVGLAPQAGHAELTIDQRVAALEAKLQYLSVSGTAMIIRGANL